MTTSPWISVKDRLPSDKDKVLCYMTTSGDQYAGEFHATWGFSKDVTHWMPLPDPPKPEDPFETWWENARIEHDVVGRLIREPRQTAKFIWDAAIASQKT